MVKRLSKESLRRQMRAARAMVDDPGERSARVGQQLTALDGYGQAAFIAFYVSVRDEVRTTGLLASALDKGRNVCVPAVDGSLLKLYRIKSLTELSPGAFGVLEPSTELRDEAGRRVPPGKVDLIVVPGLAFDRHGGRLGYGRGYYDRLLVSVPQALKIGLAYDCQMAERVPMEPTDVRVDCVITESGVHPC